MNKPIPFTNKTLATYRLRSQTNGYPLAKWVQFCVKMQEYGLDVRYYDAKTTVSKYVYLRKGQLTYKVRFSNHRPSLERELDCESDFYVGVTNTGVRTTEDAIVAALKHFKIDAKLHTINLDNSLDFP